MDSYNIKNLINYAYKYLELDSLDELYVRNRLLEACFMEEYDDNLDEAKLMDINDLDYPDVIINPILDDLVNNGKILESDREYHLCKIMDILSLRPSGIESKFKSFTEKEKAFKWLHSYSEHNSYIKASDIRKNLRWLVDDEKGGLEITINLSKPEKSNSDVKKALTQVKVNYPKCVICPENMGYAGHGTIRQNLRGHNIILGGDPWFWQFSPYAYFNEHGIAINACHTPMVVEEKNITNVLDFLDYVPEYFIGFNAALPIIGGSILAHDHYQGGRHPLPIFKSKDKYVFAHKDYPNVKVSILNWYNNVIRLESTSRLEIEELGKKIVLAWKSYDDLDNNVLARSDVQHSSITCVSRYDGRYILDFILRNNVVSDEYPEGVYHAHPEYHNIKKEAIGLIEAGGMFILPARLKRQLGIISNYLQGDSLDLESLPADMVVHKDMIVRLIEANGFNHDEQTANNIIKLEIERICREILCNTAVYKDTDAGNKGFVNFVLSNGLELL